MNCTTHQHFLKKGVIVFLRKGNMKSSLTITDYGFLGSKICNTLITTINTQSLPYLKLNQDYHKTIPSKCYPFYSFTKHVINLDKNVVTV